jgi:lipoprotein-anchoring transpeptidase ErfK/SrfK
MPQFSRRAILVGGGASLTAPSLGACVPQQPVGASLAAVAGPGPRSLPAEPPEAAEAELPAESPRAVFASYGPVPGEPFPVPAAPLSRIHPAYLRTRVVYARGERPGTIVVDPRSRYLYFVEGGGTAIRYGVGVGRQGFAWSGVATVGDKQEWPDWYPPKEMIARRPDLLRQLSELQSGPGVPGGPRNPLGARALYLWQNNKDTLYRIHGTNEPWTIGTNVSSGCIRMINQDAIDLYNRTPLGTRVVVLPAGRSVAETVG